MQDLLAITTVPSYPQRWPEGVETGHGPRLAATWIGWKRLESVVRPGDKVFLLCNFVQERRLGQSHAEQLAKCTHGSVVHVACESILDALGDGGEVMYGNAALQSSDWDRLMQDTRAGFLETHYRHQGRTVRQRDLRMLVRRRSAIGMQKQATRRDVQRNCLEIDLGEHSLLHGLVGKDAPKFRVSDYDSNLTEQCQNAINHKYIVSRDILDADVVGQGVLRGVVRLESRLPAQVEPSAYPK